MKERLKKVFISDFACKIAETYAVRLILLVIGLITTVITARILGPDGRGLYMVAVTIGAIGIQLGNLGLHASNTYYAAGDKGKLPALLGNTLVISFVLGGVGAVLTWGFSLLLPEIVPIHGALLILALMLIPFGLAYLLFQNLLLGIQEVRIYNIIEIIYKVLTIVLILLLIFINKVSIEAVFSAGLVSLIIVCALSLRNLKSHFPGYPSTSLTLFKETIIYGLKAYLAAFFAFFVLKADILIIQYMLGAEQTGYYSIAVTVAETVYMLPVVIGTILFATLSGMSDGRQKWEYAKKVIYLVSAAMIVITGISVLLARPFIILLFGKTFTASVPAFIWLMPGILMLSINTVFMNYFASIGMPLITVYSPGAASLINIILNINLIPELGIIGASISSTISYGVMLILSAVYILYMKKRGEYVSAVE